MLQNGYLILIIEYYINPFGLSCILYHANFCVSQRELKDREGQVARRTLKVDTSYTRRPSIIEIEGNNECIF